MPKPSTSADRIRKSHPEVWQRFTALADACHEAGPLDEKSRKLVKLALASLREQKVAPIPLFATLKRQGCP